jgi:hypothetical protein
MVSDPNAYPWSSHHHYLRRRGAPAWLDVDSVLGMLGGRAAYRRFVADGMTEGERPDLCGSGSHGDVGEEAGDGRRLWLGGQILGGERFARRALKGTRKRELEREMAKDAVVDLASLAADAARRFGIEVAALRSGNRDATSSAARRELVRRAVIEGSVKPVEVSRFLNIRPASITGHLRALRRAGRGLKS